MTSNEVATYQPADVPLLREQVRNEHTDGWIPVLAPISELAVALADTEFVPAALRGKPEAIVGSILFGREIDMAPLHALQNVHMIDGRPSLSAEHQRAMVLAAGHEIAFGETSGSICQIKGKRKGSSMWTVVEWTLAQAQAAGLTGKKNWQRYPSDMLIARASSKLCRMIFGDVTHGIPSTEEIEDGLDDGSTAPVGSTPATGTSRVSRAKAGITKTRETAPPPAATSGPLHGDPILPPAPVGSAQAVRSSTDVSGSVPAEAVPDAATEPPPTGAQCPHISNGVQCEYKPHGPELRHSYDPPQDEPVAHEYADAASAGDGSFDDVAATGTDEEYDRKVAERNRAEANLVAAAAAPTGPVPDAPKPMIAAQTKALQARFKGLGWTDEPDDRESRLRVVSTILGRGEGDGVETFRSTTGRNGGGMTYDEAQEVLTVLAPCRSRDDVLELLVKIAKSYAADDEEPTP